MVDLCCVFEEVAYFGTTDWRVLLGDAGAECCCEEGDDSHADDRPEIDPGSEHPGAVLFDLEFLDVDDCEDEGGGCDDG